MRSNHRSIHNVHRCVSGWKAWMFEDDVGEKKLAGVRRKITLEFRLAVSLFVIRTWAGKLR